MPTVPPDSSRLWRFLTTQRLPTPYSVLDIDTALLRHKQLVTATGGQLDVLYAVKANADPGLLSALAHVGCGMDVASPGELRQVLSAGCPADRVSYSNPFRSRDEIAFAHENGVRLFCADSPEEILRLAARAPGASVVLRLAHAGPGSMSPRFGCSPHEAVELAALAVTHHLEVAGLCWHVGTQQTDPGQWRIACATGARVWAAIRERGAAGRLRVLNLGGGLPGTYRVPTPPLHVYARTITSAVTDCFVDPPDHTFLEPGRALVADAGATVSSVKAVMRRNGRTHVILDAGLWNAGLADSLYSIEYAVTAVNHSPATPTHPVMICGPTCDTLDELSVGDAYRLPVDLAPGDRVAIWPTGAYCATNAAVNFNGYPPVTQHSLPPTRLPP
ncbi:hypothetical protein AB0F13_24470 [Streptomyces sp. NPDC026206]|uniref:hypothetical protein n=1 Tax=Streptomyces sp. NPDC026206 TaxID=3157089 RepID=UPI00340B949B